MITPTSAAVDTAFFIEALLAIGLFVPTNVESFTLTHTGWSPREGMLGSGLRLVWVGRGSCRLEMDEGRGLLLNDGAAVLVPRDLGVRFDLAGTNQLPWLMSVDIPTTSWLQGQLLRPGHQCLEELRGAAVPEALKMMRLVVQDQVLAEDSIEQRRWLMPAAEALVARMLQVLSCRADASPLAAITSDHQIGRTCAEGLLREGPLLRTSELTKGRMPHRTSFTTRFHAVSGDHFRNYLRAWRLHLSALRFELHLATVEQESQRYGYATTTGFRRAFKRIVGVQPESLHRAPTSPQAVRQRGYLGSAPIIEVSQHVSAPELPVLIASVISRL